jgi:hypothetical protein
MSYFHHLASIANVFCLQTFTFQTSANETTNLGLGGLDHFFVDYLHPWWPPFLMGEIPTFYSIIGLRSICLFIIIYFGSSSSNFADLKAIIYQLGLLTSRCLLKPHHDQLKPNRAEMDISDFNICVWHRCSQSKMVSFTRYFFFIFC